jgi:transcriptional regulator with XRE-family HTH domain
MALRRQRLSQRRKAVGLTQESLAQRLGVERSTVARWEAGDTEPLPSVRPDVARALQVSIDELAELLGQSDNASTVNTGTTPAHPANVEVATPVQLAKFQSEVWLGRAEFEELIRPQVAQTVETLRSDDGSSDEGSTEDLKVDRSSGVPRDVQHLSTELDRPVTVHADPEVTTTLDPALRGTVTDHDPTAEINTVGADIKPYKSAAITAKAYGFVGSDVPDLSSVTTIPLNLSRADVQWHRPRPRQSKWFKQFVAAGILAFVGWAAFVPFLTSDSDPINPAAGNPAPAVPVAVIPAPNPGNSNESTGTPAAAPNKPADAPAPSAVAAESTSQTSRSDNRSKPPASMRTPASPRNPESEAEAYVWSRVAERLSENDQSKTRIPSEFSQYR